jgi:Bacterial Ig-like domain (group 2)
MWRTHISPGRGVAGVALAAALASGALFVACSDGTSPSDGENLVTVASVDVTPTTSVIAVDDTVQFTATVKDASGKVLSVPVTWTSSNTAVATVDAQGRAVGIGIGSVEISASAGSKQSKGKVDVQAKAASVTVTSTSGGNSSSLSVGSTVQLVATVKDASGNVLTRTVTWSSSAATVASVDQAGLVTGVGAGSAVISATVSKVSGTYEVKVTGEVTTTGSNMSVPVDFAEGIGLTLLPLTTETGMRPLSTEGLTVDTLPYFAPTNQPDCGDATQYYCQNGVNAWQPQWFNGSGAMQSGTLAWGDNLGAKSWTSTSMIRVEVRLTRADTTLLGFNMPYVTNPSSPDELQGTDGTTAAMIPNIFAVTARMKIDKLDDSRSSVTFPYFNGAIADGSFTAEVNISGNLAYGYNFQLKNVVMPSGVLKTGWWRITFMLDPSATVAGATVNRNASLDAMAACEGAAICALDTANQTSTIDIQVVE